MEEQNRISITVTTTVAVSPELAWAYWTEPQHITQWNQASDDWHTTASDTVSLFEHAKEPKEMWLVDGAAHVDLDQADPAESASRVGSFLDRHHRPSAPTISEPSDP